MYQHAVHSADSSTGGCPCLSYALGSLRITVGAARAAASSAAKQTTCILLTPWPTVSDEYHHTWALEELLQPSEGP